MTMTWLCRRHAVQVLLGTLFVASVAGPALAGPIALDFTGGTAFVCAAAQAPGCVAGWDFHVSAPISVEAIGVWDEDRPGLAESHAVALWTSAGGLLASTSVTNASAPVGSSSPNGRWLFESIAPVTLGVGDYVLGALYSPNDSGDPSRALANAITIPQITFGQARLGGPTATLDFPTLLRPAFNDGFFGPNLQVAAVPEPVTLLLLPAGIGLLALHRRRRRP
jgi:hypothetical protein